MKGIVKRYYAVIEVYDAKTDEFVGCYLGVSNAASAVGCNASNVSKCLKGERKTAGGHKFKYADEGITVTVNSDGTVIGGERYDERCTKL